VYCILRTLLLIAQAVFLLDCIGVNLDKNWRGHDHGERGVQAYNGGLEQSPQWGPGAEPMVMGSGSEPPEAESFLRIGHPKEGANWPHVHVLNERNCNFGERGLTGGKLVV